MVIAPVNQVPQFESTKGGARKKGRSKVPNTSDKILKLTLEQKSDVISKEIDELKDEIEQKIKEQSKVLEYHKATIIECECMIADMNKSWYEFDRDIIRGGINPVIEYLTCGKCLINLYNIFVFYYCFHGSKFVCNSFATMPLLKLYTVEN
jgi:hypothetical protein